jgi:peroxin-3
MYSITLLTLFTHLQLSLLNRIKYVRSVVQLDIEEQERDTPNGTHPAHGISASLRQWLSDDSHVPSRSDSTPSLESESEMKYLTMSWWLLHVGWKDVGERVRRAVEEVLDE